MSSPTANVSQTLNKVSESEKVCLLRCINQIVFSAYDVESWLNICLNHLY